MRILPLLLVSKFIIFYKTLYYWFYYIYWNCKSIFLRGRYFYCINSVLLLRLDILKVHRCFLGFIVASVWIKSDMYVVFSFSSNFIVLFLLLIIPDVTVLLNSNPIGFPIAYTVSPILNFA